MVGRSAALGREAIGGHGRLPARVAAVERHAVGVLAVQARRDRQGGTRFRFPPTFDLDAYAADPAHPLSPYALIVARAIQKYGMIADNSAGVVSFVAEDPTPRGTNPYPGFFQNKYPNANGVFANFPWSQLEVVQPGGFGCVDKP
jgi:hypothetical protein